MNACVNPDNFLPLSSEYKGTKDPKGEAFSGYRVYVPSLDISYLVRQDDNLIAIQFGGDRYTHSLRRFGAPKAIFRIFNGIGERIDVYLSEELTAKGAIDAEFVYMDVRQKLSADENVSSRSRALLIHFCKLMGRVLTVI